MAADDKDDPGVLGNLPRSRPGRRSEKRSTASGARKTTAPKASTKARASATSQRAKRSTGARTASPRAGAKTTPPSQRSSEPQRSSGGGSDPLTGAVRLAGKVAETGVKAAVGIIKRIPGAPR